MIYVSTDLYLSIPSLREGTRWVQVDVSRLRNETFPALSPYRMRSFLGTASDITGDKSRGQ